MANTAPVLNTSTTPALPSILEGISSAANTGISVLDLASNLITDADNGLEAIAITGADSTNGTWQYSTDGGSTWENFPAGISGNNALVLGAQSLYTPGVSGNLAVAPATQPWLFYNNPMGATQTATSNGTILNTDANAGIYAGYTNYTLSGQLKNSDFPALVREQGYSLSFESRIITNTLVNNNRAGFSIIVVSSDGQRAIELAFQSLSPTTGRIFAQSDDVTANPNGQPQNLFTAAEGVDFNTNTLTNYRLQVSGSNYVLFANGAQILTGPLRNYTNFVSSNPFIPDPYNIPNFVFLGDNTTSASGSFELSDVAVQTVNRVRFVPNAGFSGNASLGFRAWDGTDGSTNGNTVNLAAVGGNTAYSSAIETATLSVIPLPPTINPIATDNIINAAEVAAGAVISGTTNAGATVTLTIANQTYFIQANGTTWSYTLTAQNIINLGQGTGRTVRAVTTVAGNNSAEQVSQPFAIDTVPPSAATIGAIATDNVIDAAEATAGVVLTGSFVATDATVSLVIAGVTRTPTVNGNTWSYTLTDADLANLGQGSGKTVTIITTDAASNTTATQSQAFTIETGAPAAPTIGAIATNNVINATEATAGVVLTGSTDAGTTVRLTIAGVTRDAEVNGTTWSYTLSSEDLTNLGQGTGKTITVTARNGVGTATSTDSQPFDIDTIPPTGITLSSSLVVENTSTDLSIATLSATDASSISYALVDDENTDNNQFRIENNQLFLNTSANFENQSSYGIRIRVTDAAGNSTESTQTITVGNANEAVTAIDLSNTFIPQNVPGAVIGTLTFTDPDTVNALRNNTLTVSDNRFEVVSVNNTLQLKLLDNQALTYNALTNGQLALTITATDASDSGLTFATTFNGLVIGTEAADSFAASSLFDRILAGGGADTVTATVANLSQSDVLDGGTGGDRLTLSGGIATNILTLTLTQPTSQLQGINGLTVQNFEQFDFSTFAGQLTVQGSAAADTVLGGAGNDSMIGGAGNDSLAGGGGNDALNGGLGADSLRGGLGNDLYTVENGGDRLTELLNQGIDTVRSAITWTLGTHLENLTLTGTRNINGLGNTRNNTLTGNRGNNALTGGAGSDRLLGGLGADRVNGGAGNDTLTGGGGRDLFQFASSRSFRRTDFGVDQITDFLRGQDRITLSARSFAVLNGLVGQALSSTQFASVTRDAAAGRVGAAIVYNRTNGHLFYNPNGTAVGFGTGGQFATLQAGLPLARTDLTVVA